MEDSNPPGPSFDDEEAGIGGNRSGGGRVSYWKKHKRMLLIGIGLTLAVVLAVVLGVTLSNNNNNGNKNNDASKANDENEQVSLALE